MKSGEVPRKIVKWILIIIIVITSLIIYRLFRDYEVLSRGILGFALVFFIIRLYFFPLDKNRFLNLEFPKLLLDIIYSLLLGISLYLALDYVKELIIWFIKLI
jgi:hypothetical protein